MTPVVIEGCFGWLHQAAGGRGVVLCPPFGHEALGTHRALRDLAERLAAQGLPTLRFDPPGSGDSLDLPPEAALLPAWRDAVRAATRALRQGTGVTVVTLVGLRLGASVALLAAEALEAVDSVACLAPVVSGRSYLRELRLLAQPGAAPAPPGALDVVGERLWPCSLEGLAALDLGRLGAAPPQVLLMEREGRERARLAAHLATLGTTATQRGFPERDAWLQDAVLSVPPEAALDALCGWLGALPRPAAAPSSPARLPARLRLADATERVVRLGEDGGLVGVLCRPDVARPNAPAGAPAVLVLNTGMTHRVGNARLGTRLARRLAGSGVATLRLDTAGIGDSLPDAGRPGLLVYNLAVVADVVTAIDWLERQGHAGVVLVGVCSGAYLALHAARADPRVRGAVLVNLQCFSWQEGGSLQVQGLQGRRPAGFYLLAALRREGWRRLLRGEVRLAALALGLAARLAGRLRRTASRRLERLTGLPMAAGEVRRWLLALSHRGTWVRLWYSEADPGLTELGQHLGTMGRELRAMPGIEVAVMAGADHALTDRLGQERFLDALQATLRAELDLPAATAQHAGAAAGRAAA